MLRYFLSAVLKLDPRFASSGAVNLQAQDLEGEILLDQPY